MSARHIETPGETQEAQAEPSRTEPLGAVAVGEGLRALALRFDASLKRHPFREESTISTATPRPPKVPPRSFVHTAWRAHRALYRLSGGRFLWTTSNKRRWGALRLTMLGRQSGQERGVIIGYVEDGPNLVAIAMNGWDEGHPSWWLNLEAHPDAVVRLTGRALRRVRAHPAPGRNGIVCGGAGSR